MAGGWTRDERGWPWEWYGRYPNELQAQIGMAACRAALDILSDSGEAYIIHAEPKMRMYGDGHYTVKAIVRHCASDAEAQRRIAARSRFEAEMVAEFAKHGDIRIERY